MKKLSAYHVSLIIESNGKVIEGECECASGLKPACCKHFFGLLSALEDYSRKELYVAPTDKLQTWHQPTPKVVSPQKKPRTFLTQSRRAVATNLNHHTVLLLLMYSKQAKMKDSWILNMMFHYLLWLHCHKMTNLFCYQYRPESSGRGQCLYEKTIPLPAFVTSGFGQDVPIVLPIDQILFYHQRVRKTLEDLIDLEKETMLQNSKLWHAESKCRLTASNVHTILHRQKDFQALCKSLLTSSKDLSNILPIKLGKLREPMVKNILRNKFSNHVFRNTGLIVHPLFPFIGASPDGLLYNQDNPMLVQVKCVFNPSRQSLEELAVNRKDFCLSFSKESKTFSLKTSHNYYSQIQLQLFCSNLNTCLFALFYDFRKPIFMELVNIDLEFCTNALNKLTKFCFKCYLPELVSECLGTGTHMYADY